MLSRFVDLGFETPNQQIYTYPLDRITHYMKGLLGGSGEWRKHRNKRQSRRSWKRERQAYKRRVRNDG